MGAGYDDDVILWAREQAKLLREGRYNELDIEHVAEEIEDVARAEEREFSGRVASLVVWLLKWHYQPIARSAQLAKLIENRRKSVARQIRRTPSLIQTLDDDDWVGLMWCDAVIEALRVFDYVDYPKQCPWTMAQVLDAGFLPD